MDPDPASSFLLLFLQANPVVLSPSLVALELGLFVGLLLCSAFISGSEVALFSLEATDQETLAETNDKASQRVLRLLSRPDLLLNTILIFNTLVNVAAAILAALMTDQFIRPWDWPEWAVRIFEIVVFTYVLLIISEITPKLIASNHAMAYSKRASGFLIGIYRIFSPLARLFARLITWIRTKWALQPALISSDDLKRMADVSQSHGHLPDEARAMIHSIVEFAKTTVREIMISRVDVVGLPMTATFQEALDLINESGHSRLPLYNEQIDHIEGIIYAKDLIPFLSQTDVNPTVNWAELVRPALFVPLTKQLDDLLEEFQTKKTHICIVVDEYGGTEGIVTLEDVVEEIIGEIHDEYDEEHVLYTQLADQSYRFDARIDLDDLNEILDTSLDTESFDFETLGGLVLNLAGRIPQEGDTFTMDHLAFEVETVAQNRIVHVKVQVLPAPETSAES